MVVTWFEWLDDELDYPDSPGTAYSLYEFEATRRVLENSEPKVVQASDPEADPAEVVWMKEQKALSCLMLPLGTGEKIIGFVEVVATEQERNFTEDEIQLCQAMAGQAAIAIDNAALFDDLQRSNTELTLAYDTTLEGWARALELRDKETEGHTQRVTEMTLRLATAMGVPEAELVHVRRGALLHDIGKMGIPDSILLKPGPLSESEWEIMRMHPVYAYEMLSPIGYLRSALDIPYCHHEKWDGSGYPRGLAGEQIPLHARIFAVADV
jgi:putative nucleotidyltransferase with HDIG domain